MSISCRKSCRRCHRGCRFFVVPTPPEIAAACGITDARCRPPDALQWDDLATCFPPVAGAASEGIASMIYTSCTTGNPKGVRRLDIGADPAQLRTFLMNKVFGIAPDRVVRAVITGPRRPVIYEYYGATEAGAFIIHGSEEALAKPGTVGRPRPGGTVRIYDADGGSLPTGAVGEIHLWLEGVPDFTYHGLDDKRHEVGRDGLVTLRDVGYLDEDGYLFICDRARDMVISGGVNIYPAEVEMALLSMPRVRDCGVFGIQDDEFGERSAPTSNPIQGAARRGRDHGIPA
jgi:acyl-CoA synthetase (AMP-forming)/AMP-acid ligase II